MAIQIQLRRGSESQWTSVNPVLAEGEMGLALDVSKFKIGDGVKSWNQLNYATAAGGSVDWSVATTQGSAINISTGTATNTLYYGNFITVESTHAHPYINTSDSSLYQPAGAYLTTAAQSIHTHDYQSTGNYLTTAALSNHTHSDLYQSTGAYLTTAMASNESHIRELNVSNGSYWGNTVNLRESTNITISADGASIKFSVADAIPLANSTAYNSTVLSSVFQTTGAYLTTAMESGMSSAFQYTSNTSAITSNAINTSVTSQWLTTAAASNHTHLYAGTGTSATNASITLDSNGLAISVAAPGAAAENNYISIYGNTSNASTVSGSSILLSAGNNITLAVSNGSVKIEGVAGGDTSNAMNTSERGNYFYTSNNTFLTTAALSNHTHSDLYINTSISNNFQQTSATSAITANALNTSVSGSFQLTADNSLSLGTGYTTHTHNYQSAGAYLTSQSNQAASASNGSFTFETLSFGSGSITFYTNASGIQGSYSHSTHAHDYVATANSSLFQHTSATSAITSNALNTSQSSLFQHTSATSAITSNAFPTANSTQLAVSSVASRAIQVNGSSGSLSLAVGSSLSASSNASTITFGLASNITTALAAVGHTHSDLYVPIGNSTQWATSILDDSLMALSYSSAFQTATLASTFAQTANIMNTSERNNYFYTSNNTFANNTHAHGGLTINATNISTSITSASNGLTINLSAANPGAGGGIAASIGGNSTSGGAGYSNITSGTMILAGGNNITLSQDGSIITVIGGAGGAGAALQGSGTYTQNSGTIQFANSNSITFGLTNNQMTASFSQSTHSHDFTQYAGILTTGITGGSATINSSQLQINIPIGTVNFSDGSGISWGSSVGTGASSVSTTITGSIQQAYYLSGANTAGTTSFSGGSALTLSGGNNITLSGNSNNQIVISAGAGGGGVAMIVSDATYTSGSVSFRGTNITIGTSAGGQYIDLSVGAGGGVGTGTTITGNASITLGTAGMSFNGSGLAGTNTGATNCAVTVNSSGVSVFGTVGSGVTTGTTSGTALAVTLNTAGINITYPNVGYLSLVNSNGYTWSTSTNGVSTAIWLVLAHTA